MARVLTRPLFRKGGLSQTPRPTYRGGCLTTIRPRYRNGGMNGIMSGIVPRRGYQLGTGDALGVNTHCKQIELKATFKKYKPLCQSYLNLFIQILKVELSINTN